MDLAATLHQRLAAAGRRAPEDVDAVIALQVDHPAPRRLATLVIERGVARLERDAATDEADATFTFDRADTALGVLAGEADPFDAFFGGRFRTDSHLPLVFVVRGLFRAAWRGRPAS